MEVTPNDLAPTLLDDVPTEEEEPDEPDENTEYDEKETPEWYKNCNNQPPTQDKSPEEDPEQNQETGKKNQRKFAYVILL